MTENNGQINNSTSVGNNEVQNPIISVIVPAYNVEKYIGKCLTSLINQTISNIEIIITDDGSADNTKKIISDYAASDKRIIYLQQENLGPSEARNKGLQLAKGKYISFVDSDDWIDNDFLEKLYSAIIRYDADIACATAIRKRRHIEKYRVYYDKYEEYQSLEDKIRVCGVPNSCYIWNKLYRSDLIRGRKFQKGVYFEDILWLPEVIKSSKKLITVPDVKYYYRANNNSIVKKYSPKKQNDSYNAKKYIIEFFDSNNLTLSSEYRVITKEIKNFLNFPIAKIKEFEGREYFKLFDFLTLYTKKETENRCVYNVLGIKINSAKNKLSDEEYKKLNFEYENNNAVVPNLKSKYETLEELTNTQKSIARYGDGEFNLIFGEDISFQKYDKNLSQRLKEILVSDNEKVMVALPDIFANLNKYTPEVVKFWRKYIVANRDKLYSIINLEKQYYDSFVTRPYINMVNKSESAKYFDSAKKIWEAKDVIFVEGEASRLGYKNDLFENAKSIKRIICPAKNAYEKYDEILTECKKQNNDVLFIIALGPVATVLAYDLANTGYRALDLGHIDIEYEWFLKKADKKIPIKDKYVNEVRKGKTVTKLDDTGYKKEIIVDFTKE